MICTLSADDSPISGSWKAAKRPISCSARNASTEALGAMSWLTAITPSCPSMSMRLLQLAERRQFLDARRAPARPQIDQHRHAAKFGQADVAAVGIVEHAVGRRLALVAPVDPALDPGDRRARRLALLRIRLLPIAAGNRQQRKEQQHHPHRQLQ